jgi:rubrerythrin
MYPYIYNYTNLNRQSDKLVRDIQKAISRQYSAIQCYAKLAKMAPTDKERA